MAIQSMSYSAVVASIEDALDLFQNEPFKEFYVKADPLASAIIFVLLLSAAVIVLAEITSNYSQVDRLWSILPAFYISHFALNAHLNDYSTQRLAMASTASILWSIRLTFNYWRKGGYEWATEDYRWPILRTWVPKPLFFIFNIVFIGLYQNLLLLWVSTPAYLFFQDVKSAPIYEEGYSTSDIAFAAGLVIIVVFEFFADQQQWDFQCAKSSFKETAKPNSGYTQEEMLRGFVTRGLWSYSRHPNFLAEQAVWVTLYIWGAMVSESPLNWTIFGMIGYCGIFQGSTWLTEKLSSEKYPEYQEYQKHVSRFVPNISSLWRGGGAKALKEHKQ